MKLFSFAFPPKSFEGEADPMYFRDVDERAEIIEQDGQTVLSCSIGANIKFNTYFNCLPFRRYLEYTNVREVEAVLLLTGSFLVSVCCSYSDPDVEGLSEEIIKEVHFPACTADNPVHIAFHLPEHLFSFPGFIYIKFLALENNGTFHGGYWGTSDSATQNVYIGIGMCTYKREEYVRKNVDTITNRLIECEASPMHDKAEVYIADNGQTLKKLDWHPGKCVKIFENRNYGGSGGFTRTLIEMAFKETSFTHFLLLDDDILLEPQAIEKTYTFLQHCLPEFSDIHIGGAMLSIEKPTYQFEMGAVFDTDAHSRRRWHVDAVNRLIDNDRKENENFNGWYFICMPRQVVRSDNLPMPFFIKGDDIEFGLRNIKFGQLVLMNGVAVWHEQYTAKYSPHLAYFTTRNKMATRAIRATDYSASDFIKFLDEGITNALLKQRYDSAFFIIQGAEDFLKGIDYLLSQKEDERLADLLAQRMSIFVTREELNASGYQFDEEIAHVANPRRSFLKRAKAHLSLSGTPLYKALGNQDFVVVDYHKCKPYQLSGSSAAIQWNFDNDTGILTKNDPELHRALIKRKKDLFNAIENHFDEACNDYRTRYKEVACLRYWIRHLDLDEEAYRIPKLLCEYQVTQTKDGEDISKKKNILSGEVRPNRNVVSRRVLPKPLYERYARIKRVITRDAHRHDFVDYHASNLIKTKRTLLRALGISHYDSGITAMETMRNKHLGQRCFIVCTGPTLTIEDLEALKNEFTIGVNTIYTIFPYTDWRPSYYVMCDASGYRRQDEAWDFESFATEKVFLNRRIHNDQPFSNKVIPFNFVHTTSDHYMPPIEKPKASTDPSICIYDRFTVANAAIDLALYMGFKNIYLLGVDHNYSGIKRHFVETKDDATRKAPDAKHLKLCEDGYRVAKDSAARCGARVYNATRGGKLEIFERVDLDEVLLEKAD